MSEMTPIPTVIVISSDEEEELPSYQLADAPKSISCPTLRSINVVYEDDTSECESKCESAHQNFLECKSDKLDAMASSPPPEITLSSDEETDDEEEEDEGADDEKEGCEVEEDEKEIRDEAASVDAVAPGSQLDMYAEDVSSSADQTDPLSPEPEQEDAILSDDDAEEEIPATVETSLSSDAELRQFCLLMGLRPVAQRWLPNARRTVVNPCPNKTIPLTSGRGRGLTKGLPSKGRDQERDAVEKVPLRSGEEPEAVYPEPNRRKILGEKKSERRRGTQPAPRELAPSCDLGAAGGSVGRRQPRCCTVPGVGSGQGVSPASSGSTKTYTSSESGLELKGRAPGRKRLRGAKKPVAEKEPAETGVLRRNPKRAIAPPVAEQRSERRENWRGQRRRSPESDSPTRQRTLRPRVYKNSEGAVYNPPGKLHLLPRKTWPADTLERPTLADVYDAIPQKPPPVTWANVAHHILHCVLEMIARRQSTDNSSLERVAGKLLYIETVQRQILAAEERATIGAKEKAAGDAKTKKATTMSKGVTRKNDADVAAALTKGILLIDLEEEITDGFNVKKDAEAEADNGEGKTDGAAEEEVDIGKTVCAFFDKVCAAEQALRDEVVQRAIEIIRRRQAAPPGVPEATINLDDFRYLGPDLDDLKALLVEAGEVYLLANKDVTRDGLTYYLNWVEAKEESRRQRRNPRETN